MWQITIESSVNADYCFIKYVYSYILKKFDVACFFRLNGLLSPPLEAKVITTR